MPIELRELRWATVAAQYRSLRQAAGALSVRQSTLSRCLRELEDKLGITLFERSNSGTRPTLAGREFLVAAQHITNEVDVIAKRFRNYSQGKGGKLTIGVQASLSAGNLRATLIDYRHRFPEVEHFLIDGASNELTGQLTTGVVDVAFVVEGNFRWKGESLPVWSERVVVALPENNSLARSDTVRWIDLRKCSLLVPERGPGPEFVSLVTRKLRGSETYHIDRHDVSLDRFLTLVGAGYGVLLALEGATGPSYPGVVFREMHDEEGPTRLNFRACWNGSNDNPALRSFLEMLRERYPDLSDSGASN